jgi:hypothetical protein
MAPGSEKALKFPLDGEKGICRRHGERISGTLSEDDCDNAVTTPDRVHALFLREDSTGRAQVYMPVAKQM